MKNALLPKCGLEVGAWMSFCPRCGTLLAPITAQRRWYGYRSTSFYIPNISLFVLFGVMWILRLNAFGDVTWYSQLMWLEFGTAAGLIAGTVGTRKQLDSLTKKGEIRGSRSYTLFIFGGVLVFGGLFLAAMFAFPSLLHLILVAVFDSFLGVGIAGALAQAFLVIRWEKTHKMRLYQPRVAAKDYRRPDC